MRGFAVVVNLIQMGIVLALFLTHGMGLGATTIFALFLMLIIAFINLLVLLFHSALTPLDQAVKSNEKIGLVKRQDLRVLYTSTSQPWLEVKARRFPVLDLSENGIRISIDRPVPLRKRFHARLLLLSEQILPLKLTLVRRQGNEAALVFQHPIDYAVVLAEKQKTGK
jgi:hypothetical protein